MKEKILVCGGAGFIGSHMCKVLNEAGYDPVVLDNLSTGNRKAVRYGPLVEGDVGSDALSVLKNDSFVAVMHFAASINVEESVREPSKYYQNNVSKTLLLLDAMRKQGINKFIFSSSAAIFGIPREPQITEMHVKEPINPYGRSKLMVEQILSDYAASYGLDYVSLRYFNAAGGDPDYELKNFKSKEYNLIPVVLKNLKEGNRPTMVFGTDYPTKDGTCVRDYIHVMDLADAHLKALERIINGKSSRCYNLGNGKGYSVREVIRTVEKVTGLRVNVHDEKRRPGDPDTLIANGALARKELGWEPKYSLEEMIDHAWKALS